MAIKDDERVHVITRVLIGVVMTFVLSITASIIGWLVLQNEDRRVTHEETDRTQDVVLQRLNAIEATLSQMPNTINEKAADRWTRTMMGLYMEPIEARLKRLESFHPPYDKHR